MQIDKLAPFQPAEEAEQSSANIRKSAELTRSLSEALERRASAIESNNTAAAAACDMQVKALGEELSAIEAAQWELLSRRMERYYKSFESSAAVLKDIREILAAADKEDVLQYIDSTETASAILDNISENAAESTPAAPAQYDYTSITSCLIMLCAPQLDAIAEIDGLQTYEQQNNSPVIKKAYELIRKRAQELLPQELLQQNAPGYLAAYAPASNTALAQLTERVFNWGGRVRQSAVTSTAKINSYFDPVRNAHIISYSNRNRTQQIAVLDPATFYNLYNTSVDRLFKFTLQKIMQQHSPRIVTIDLHELVDMGMYTRVNDAFKAMETMFSQVQRMDFQESIKSKGKGKDPVMTGGILFYHRERIGCMYYISINDKFPLELFTREYSYFPKWGYTLHDKAYVLLSDIIRLSRMHDKIKAVNEKGCFSMSLTEVHEKLALPTLESDIIAKSRKGKQKIKDPITEAIAEINAAAAADTSIDGTLRVELHAENTSDIARWLEGYITVYLSGDYTKHIEKLWHKQGTYYEAYKEEKLKQTAKIQARNDAAAETPKRKRGRPPKQKTE